MIPNLTVPCRGCGNTNQRPSDHVYGERTCCPDCDHRPEGIRDRVAEVVAGHDPEVGHREAYCSCGAPIGEWAEGWSNHLADALAAAGLLAEDPRAQRPVTVAHGVGYPPGEIIDVNWTTMTPTYKPSEDAE